MSRCLLHKTKLDAFKAWLEARGVAVRPGNGNFEVMQVEIGPVRGAGPSPWHCVFDRMEAPEHYTVAWPLESTVRQFISEQGEAVLPPLPPHTSFDPERFGIMWQNEDALLAYGLACYRSGAEAREADKDAQQSVRDAARWRWIQPHFRVFSPHIDGNHHYCPTGAIWRITGPTFGAAVDAAIRAAEGDKQP